MDAANAVKKRGTPNPERPRLQAAWVQQIGAAPPAFLSVPFMKAALEFERQCTEKGGYPATTRRQLDQIAKGKPISETNAGSITAGAHLIRDWNGRTYQIEVVKDGFVLDGKTWKSLSAIAKHITGTTWSGPRFFGLSKVGGGQTT